MPIGKIAEFVTSNLEAFDAKSLLADHLPLDRLQELGIDPTILEGLSADEITTKLTEAGVDLNDFAGMDVQEIVAQLTQAIER